jgi:biopolymer transport protein TolR
MNTDRGERAAIADEAMADVMTRRAKRKVREQHALEELNLVPYLDVSVNLIIFLLVTISAFLPLGMLSIFPMPAGVRSNQDKPEEKQELTLSVFIRKDGFTVAAAGGVLPLIPKTPEGEYDQAKLAEMAVEIKDAYPNESRVVIVAEPDVKYDVLVATMDTLRNQGDRLLFHNVQLSPGIVGVQTLQ